MELINKQKIIDYIEKRHLADGGYFFAQVEPSSGLDTYLAVKTLRLLDVKTKNVKSIADFWKRESSEGNLDDLYAVFLAVETYKELELPFTAFKKFKSELISQNKRFFLHAQPAYISKSQKLTFTYAMDIIEARGKGLQDLYYLVTLSRDLKFEIDKKKIANFIYSLQNQDGGFGHRNESHWIFTYHALSILDTLSLSVKNKNKILALIIQQLDKSDYLEDLFYSVISLALLGEPLPNVEEIISFIDSCQRNNGGFSRARVMGISSIEHTYMAVSVLKACEKSTGKKFIK